MKTKILSFILFAIFLIFTSCGDGNNNISDNPQFEQSVLDSITVKTLPTKTQYSVGETLNPTGLVLVGNYIDNYSDGSTQTSNRDIDYSTYKNELTFSPTNLTTEGIIKITVTYNEKSTTFDVTVGKSSSNSEYPSWFKTVDIGGEDSPYKTCYIDVSEFNEENRDKTQIDQFNLRTSVFQDYINKLGFTDIQLMKFGETNDQTNNITTVDNNFDTSVYRIKEYCKDIIKEITKNINISNNKTLDQQQFVNYYKAISAKAYYDAYSDNVDSTVKESYTETKNSIKKAWTNIHKYHNTDAPISSIYQEVTDGNGEVSEIISSEVITQLNLMLNSASTNMNKSKDFLQNVMNLSWVIDSVDAIHDYTKTDTCTYTNNTMADVIQDEITL